VPNCLADPDCNDGNICTTDTCDVMNNVCVYTPNTLPCSDNSLCTTGDVCNAGVCSGAPIVCDDGEPCNGAETCSALVGCQAGPPLVCDDASACNGLETCVVGVGCVPGEGPFLVDSKASVGNFCVIGGSLGANAANGSVRLGRGSTMADMTTLIASRLTVAQGASAFRVEYDTIRLNQSATVRNSSSSPAPLPIQTPYCPIPAPFPACNATNAVSVGFGGAQTLTPGVYGAVNVLNEGILTLQPGNYVMCSLRTARAVTVIVNGPGATTIDVVDRVQFGNLTVVQLASAPAPTIRVDGKRVKIATDSNVSAFVSAPNANFSLGHNAKFTGSFCSAKAKASNGSELACQ
jgi:hypothetical protein